MDSPNYPIDYLNGIIPNSLVKIIKEYYMDKSEDKNFIKLTYGEYINISAVRELRIYKSSIHHDIKLEFTYGHGDSRFTTSNIKLIRDIIQKINNSELTEDFNKMTKK